MITEGYFLIFLIETIFCDPSSESSQDASDEGHNIVLMQNHKHIPNYHQTLSYPELCIT